jgi:MFS family permease
MQMPWQAQIAVMLIPTAIYAYLMYGQEFPEEDYAEQSTGSNLAAMMTPLYIFIACCMCLTATSELGTQQWIEKLLGSAGAKPMLVLAMVTGLMAVGRYFAGPVIHRFNPIGVLLGSSVLATIGIGLMSQAQGSMVYVAAVMFAAGVCYFWPTMIGLVAEYVPKSGAFGMSIMGGIGMFATSLFQPVIGGWMDAERAKATASGVAANTIELVAGQNTLDNIAALPFLLILAFAGLYFTKGKLWDKAETV